MSSKTRKWFKPKRKKKGKKRRIEPNPLRREREKIIQGRFRQKHPSREKGGLLGICPECHKNVYFRVSGLIKLRKAVFHKKCAENRGIV